MAWHQGIGVRGQRDAVPQLQLRGCWRWKMVAQQVCQTPMLNIPWGASMLVIIFLYHIRTQKKLTASIATSWMTSNKVKSRRTSRSARWHCASTRTVIDSRNGTLNSYSKHKHVLTMWHICLFFLGCNFAVPDENYSYQPYGDLCRAFF